MDPPIQKENSPRTADVGVSKLGKPEEEDGSRLVLNFARAFSSSAVCCCVGTAACLLLTASLIQQQQAQSTNRSEIAIFYGVACWGSPLDTVEVVGDMSPLDTVEVMGDMSPLDTVEVMGDMSPLDTVEVVGDRSPLDTVEVHGHCETRYQSNKKKRSTTCQD
ncbi:hypothetical protein KUCAC02_003052 [Chaenocephalus aceratus]|uniref:Uncharacterized protein n=1 Tax=Chaenocephalus aceratus TaxID=36190 RepID=A0ACB9WJG6_CHAAC|nr:hypothetical protein KUCAC02_003052 [Chaenocephalus aceratus]